MLFEPAKIGTLTVPNRLVRSATAERLTDEAGRPKPAMLELYRQLVTGGVGLIITGHMYVHPSGKAHLEMAGIYTDNLIPALTDLTDTVHREGGLVAVQINHGGMQCSRETVAQTIAPSAIDAPFLNRSPREMTHDEIEATIKAYAQAARRAQVAGFDAVQLHGAHGYLISQFLSPFTNRRKNEWGGDLNGRMRFLRAVCAAVREQVGTAYPVFIKLGIMDGMDGGLTIEEGVQVAAVLEELGLDGIEISGGIGGGKNLTTRTAIRAPEDEAYFRPLARRLREVTALPILLVGGLRSREVMEDVLASGDADFISVCRPLICEPDFPNRLREGQERARCISGNRCWPDGMDEGIACKCLLK
jgi:2,4-dienoyl-CoA reductase-like NADH-dependent reductase (Old Yellow Enzyme family)